MTPAMADEPVRDEKIGEAEAFVAAVVALAARGVPADMQELLIRGNDALNVKPNALYEACTAWTRALTELQTSPAVGAGEPVATFEIKQVGDHRTLSRLRPETWWLSFPPGVHALYASEERPKPGPEAGETAGAALEEAHANARNQMWDLRQHKDSPNLIYREDAIRVLGDFARALSPSTDALSSQPGAGWVQVPPGKGVMFVDIDQPGHFSTAALKPSSSP